MWPGDRTAPTAAAPGTRPEILASIVFDGDDGTARLYPFGRDGIPDQPVSVATGLHMGWMRWPIGDGQPGRVLLHFLPGDGKSAGMAVKLTGVGLDALIDDLIAIRRRTAPDYRTELDDGGCA